MVLNGSPHPQTVLHSTVLKYSKRCYTFYNKKKCDLQFCVALGGGGSPVLPCPVPCIFSTWMVGPAKGPCSEPPSPSATLTAASKHSSEAHGQV